jgi:hypothetical protein
MLNLLVNSESVKHGCSSPSAGRTRVCEAFRCIQGCRRMLVFVPVVRMASAGTTRHVGSALLLPSGGARVDTNAPVLLTTQHIQLGSLHDLHMKPALQRSAFTTLTRSVA